MKSIHVCLSALAIGSAVAAAGAPLRMVSYNVHHCAGADRRVDVPRVAEAISREKPDFVGLNEVDRCALRSHRIDMPEELGRLTGLHATFAQAIPLQGGGLEHLPTVNWRISDLVLAVGESRVGDGVRHAVRE